MNFKDYKFWFIRRENSGFITEAGINYYEGEYKMIENQAKEMVNTYVRIKKLDLKDLNPKTINRLDGSKSARYTPEDFGKIKTDDELRTFLNEQLAKVKGLEAIAKQKWQKS